MRSKIRIIGSTPTRNLGEPGAEFILRFQEAALWADRAGWRAALIYTSNNALDPWLLAQLLIERTKRLRPLVAVQPAYSHPFTVANQVATLSALYNRGVDLNFVAGDHPRDRAALGDDLEHDDRYERLGEHAAIVSELLASPRPVSRAGEHYRVSNLQLVQRPSIETRTDLLMSGSSEAALRTARKIGACAIQYPGPPSALAASCDGASGDRGVRLGIIARPKSADAWEAARQRYPIDADGAELREYASQVSDSKWVRALQAAEETVGVYWLAPFRNFHRACPYLVGDYDEVRTALKAYFEAGYRTFLVDSVEGADEAFGITELFASVADLEHADQAAE